MQDIRKIKSPLLAGAAAKHRAKQIELSIIEIIPKNLFIITEEFQGYSVGIQGVTPGRAEAWARIKNLENNPDAAYALLEYREGAWVKTYTTELSKVEHSQQGILAAH